MRARTAARHPGCPLATLSARERHVADLVTLGLANQQIARRLDCAPSTVSNVLWRVYRRLNLHSRTDLALLVYRHDPTPL